MKKITILILTIFALGCQSQTEQKFNLGFEHQSKENTLSDGWINWGSYILSIDSLSNSGQKSGKITSNENGSFGSIAYKIPANYKGKTIQLEGFMKIQNVRNGFAGLFLRVDGNGKYLAFDNMQKQNISGTLDWQKYTITLNYPEDAENIFVAGILTGKGEAWFDDFTLTIDGKSVQTLEEIDKPIYKAYLDKEFDKGSKVEISELTTELSDNLELLGRIWGFLKYHHPEICKGNYNWDYELFRFLPNYMKETDILERDKLLLDWIESFGVINICNKCETTASDAFLKPDLEWIECKNLSQSLKEKLLFIYNNRHQGKQFYIKKTPNVGNPEFIHEYAYSNMSYPDDGFRILAF